MRHATHCWPSRKAPVEILAFELDRFDRQIVQCAHDLLVLDAIAQHRLPVQNFVEVDEADRQHLPDDAVNIFVAGRHRAVQRVEFEILGQRLFIPERFPVPREVVRCVEQVCFHDASRSLMRS